MHVSTFHSEAALFNIENEVPIDTDMPQASKMQGQGQKMQPMAKNVAPKFTEKLNAYIKNVVSQTAPKSSGPSSPMQLASQTLSNQYIRGEAKPQMPQFMGEAKQQTSKNAQTTTPFKQMNGETQQLRPQTTALPQMKTAQHTATKAAVKSTKGEQNSTGLQARRWKKEETHTWWQTRYHKKEREGGGQRDQQQQQQKRDEKKKKSKVMQVDGEKKLNPCSEDKGMHVDASISQKNSKPQQRAKPIETIEMTRPALERPKTGIFALYFILTKIGIFSDGASTFTYKKEIENIDSETTKAHEKRLEELKTAITKEKSSQRWGIASKFFSWVGSCMGLIAGASLIVTGVGAVAGAMLIAASVIQITSQLLELTGGWEKIAAMLPGDDPDAKRAVISWMQIGVAVLCLVLSGAGALWGGFSHVTGAMQQAQTAVGGIAALGHGVTTIGEGVAGFLFKNSVADMKRHEITLAKLKHKRQDLFDKMEWGLDRIEKFFEDLARALDFESELFRADQMINRR